MISTSAATGRLLLCLVIGLPLQAQAAQVSLADILRAALQLAPGGEMSGAYSAEAAAWQSQANSLFASDPAFVLRHQTDAFGDDLGLREWEAGMEVPLWLPGQRADRRQEAEGLRAQADAYTALRHLEVAGELRDRLWRLLIAREAAARANEALASAQDLETAVKRRVEAGELARAELNLVRKETLVREAELQQAESEATLAEEHYRRYTGADLLPAGPQEPVWAGESLPATHPRLAMVAARAQRARAARDRIRGERRANPSLYIAGLHTRDVSGAPERASVDLQLRVPLGLSSQAAPALAAAERALTESLAELARTRFELGEELHHAESALQAARDRLELADRQHKLAEQGVRLATRAFELGESDLFKLIAARQQAVQAQRELALGALELGQAIARFNQAAGVVPQ